jgi:hypothetical protein
VIRLPHKRKQRKLAKEVDVCRERKLPWLAVELELGDGGAARVSRSLYLARWRPQYAERLERGSERWGSLQESMPE